MTPFEVFCCNLAEAIKASAYSRAELADRLGVQPATIKSWCVGRRAPTVVRMLELCELLEVDAEELFRAPDEPRERYECPVCAQSFRRMVGLRIHVSLRAREDDEHEQLVVEGIYRPHVSVLRGAAEGAPQPRPPISYAASY